MGCRLGVVQSQTRLKRLSSGSFYIECGSYSLYIIKVKTGDIGMDFEPAA